MKYLLERITTGFSPLEDRIKLVSQVANEGSIIIWITRRLLALMLPTLLEHVESGSANRSKFKATAPVGDASAAAGYESMRQEFAQLAANEQLQRNVPVRSEPNGAVLLPTAVDFKVKNDTVILIFRDDGGNMATLALEEIQLRQWLQMLHKCAEREGGWQIQLWPDWLSGASLSKVPHGLAVH